MDEQMLCSSMCAVAEVSGAAGCTLAVAFSILRSFCKNHFPLWATKSVLVLTCKLCHMFAHNAAKTENLMQAVSKELDSGTCRVPP